MKYRGINLGNVKMSNRSAVLQVLNDQGATSRKDIAEAVGLTPATVTMICNDLLEEGIIQEIGEAEEEKRAGRKKILVDINYAYRNILCISIEANETTVSITDLAGNVIGECVFATDTEESPALFLQKVASESKSLMKKHKVAKGKILGVGVSVPGKVDRAHGVSVQSYSVWDEAVSVKEILEKELDLPAIVENNVKAWAESEIIFGTGRQKDHLLLIKWGPGVGAAMIIDSEIYQGATGSAAEIGHNITDRNGLLCKCGKRGCLETVISTHAIMRAIKDAYEEDSMPGLAAWLAAGNEMTYKNTKEWASIPDASLQAIIDERIEHLAHGVANTAEFVDPDQIIVCGYLFDVPGFLDRFKEIFKLYHNFENTEFISRSELADTVAHMAPLSLVMNEMFF